MIHMQRRKNRRKDGNITILLIPGRTAETRTLSISRRLVGGIAGILLAFVISFIWLGYTMYAARADIKNINEIKADNKKKSEQIENMGRILREIEKEKESITEEQQEIKRLMGITRADTPHRETPSRGAMGGGAHTYALGSPQGIQQGMEFIQQYLRSQREELHELRHQVQGNRNYYLALPNSWPLSGRITSEFGWRKSPFSRRQEYHGGLDVAADTGTPVRAAGKGKVIYAGRDRVYGRLIKIDHGHGYITWYGHNRQILVEKGETVEKGQIIARVGSSGRSSGPHLHFTVEKNGICRNPLDYLPEVGS